MSQDTQKRTPLNKFKRVCGECGKEFYCLNPGEYWFVLVINKVRVFFCCHSCWQKAKRKYGRTER